MLRKNLATKPHPDEPADFMIHLLWLKSYNEHVHDYIRTEHLSETLKVSFARKNADSFLFG